MEECCFLAFSPWLPQINAILNQVILFGWSYLCHVVMSYFQLWLIPYNNSWYAFISQIILSNLFTAFWVVVDLKKIFAIHSLIHIYIYIYVQLFKNVLCIYLPGGFSDWLGHWRKQKGIKITILSQDPYKHRHEELIVIQRNILFPSSFTAMQTSCLRSRFPLVIKEEHKNIHASTHLKNL